MAADTGIIILSKYQGNKLISVSEYKETINVAIDPNVVTIDKYNGMFCDEMARALLGSTYITSF